MDSIAWQLEASMVCYRSGQTNSSVVKGKKREIIFNQSNQGYRYYAGVGVPASCEEALNYYQKVSGEGYGGVL